MVLRSQGGALSSTGLGSLKYFTVLSNLLEGAASLIWLIAQCRKKKRASAEKWKYTAAVSVGLTFCTVALFLGPLFGYSTMFVGVNFWFHLVIPLLSAAECMGFSTVSFTPRDNALALLPMLAYGAAYVVNALIHGVGPQPDSHDFYGFLTWGYPVGAVIFLLILAATYLIGLILRRCGPSRHSKAKT